MKSTKSYIREFGLNDLDKARKFNREEFLKTFGEEFNERVLVTLQACKKMDVQFTYQKFLNLVSEQHNKFNAISNKKLGGVLSEDLFKAFYAMYVVKHREELFPEEHQRLAQKAEQQKLAEIERQEKILAEIERQEAQKKLKDLVNKQKAMAMVSSVKGKLEKKGVKIITEEDQPKVKSKSSKKSKGL